MWTRSASPILNPEPPISQTKNEQLMKFKISDKIMRVGSNDKEESNPNAIVYCDYSGPMPQFGLVYVVEDVWDTALGQQLIPVGFGPAPVINGTKTGWFSKHFRLLSQIQSENMCSAWFKQVEKFFRGYE